ncbi:MAG: hypothetical protein N3G19_01010 [Candidatus Pacearchaeota archaeon]|nr:hypothetical protein [Candidatus Pacearchaeota archaeon]
MNPVGLNVNNVLEKKNKILEILKNKGPSLPSAISREIGVSLLFTSALLSEMINDKLVKCSHLKIGGSPLYYLSGQEIMLENFTKHLQAKEKEIFDLLKEKQVLNEELLEPAHRVAIKNIKDFAFSFKINEDKEKVFWRFHSLNQEDALEIAKKLSKQKEKITEAEKEIKGEERMKEKEKTEKRDVIEKEIGIRVRKKDKTELYNKVYEYLKNSGIETFEKINQDGIVCIALINFSFGIIKMLIVTSRKKKINEGDLSLAYQEGLSRKMPVLFLINGELTKKAKEYLNALGNYIFVKKM